jgi:hypothetical protein
MGLMFILAGLLTLLGTGAALLYSPMRRVERDLPDVLPDEPPPPAPVAEMMAEGIERAATQAQPS